MDNTPDTLSNFQKIAIVGIGCRYGNGINNVKTFWEMLVKGLDCTTPIPPDRFDTSYFISPGEKLAGKMYNQNGGFISQDPYEFDRQFFKMPPDEAAHMDPQVRLLLEVAWEALENAGIPPSSIRGSKTGVYMGVTASEYTLSTGIPYHNMNQYSNSGCNSCMVSNRISYEFDLRGPSFSVDTACSSSIYSVYLACEALRVKSCFMALAGGVNLILSPQTSIGFCQAGMLSGDGKCKSFDKAADGYSRSEGIGVLVLKPLEDALNAGDRVYAVIRGGALSNDGRTPGIANPSYAAQVDLVKTACRHADIDPKEVAYAEAHGTGTAVGDTTEANALGKAMGKERQLQHPPLYIGSVKSNVGHSEGAAGVAGLIKVALCLYQQKIPRVVHFTNPNENVEFQALKIIVPDDLISWPKGSKLLATCSSFGFGGANANLVLEGVKNQQPPVGCKINDDNLSCLLLSADNKRALLQRVKDWIDFLTADEQMSTSSYLSVLYTAAARSQHLTHRIGFAVHSREDAIRQMQFRLDEEAGEARPAHARYVEGVASLASDTAQQVVFVFSGMGTQWWGMARELMVKEPLFASKIKVVDTILKRCGAQWSLVDMLSSETDHERINQTEISQPCLFAVAVGLLDLWKTRRVVPSAVIGHSVGEVAAAYASGLLSLEHAVQLIYRRGRELRKTSGSGKMLAVLHRIEDALRFAEDNAHAKMLDVAAINSPGQVVFSGDSLAVEGLSNDMKAENIKCVILKVNNAFHSSQQEKVKEHFLKKVSEFLKVENATGRNTVIPMMSTVTGRYLTAEEANSPQYWFQNVRHRVGFMDALQNLAKDGFRVFVEVGPHSSLLPAIRDTLAKLQDAETKFLTNASLIRPRDTNMMAADSENLLLSQLKLHVEGVPVDFQSMFVPAVRQVWSIPTYPWQREQCSNVTQEARDRILFPFSDQHLLLGNPQKTFYFQDVPVKIWRADMNASTVPWIKDHVLQDAVVVPAAAFTEVGLAVAKTSFGSQYPLLLSELNFDRFMFAPDAKGCLETTLEEKAPEKCLLTLRSFDATGGKWIQHCHMYIDSPSAFDNTCGLVSGKLDQESILQRCNLVVSRSEFYQETEECGFRLGSTFKGIQKILMSEDYREVYLTGEAPPGVHKEFHRYVCHPGFLDMFLQGLIVLQSRVVKQANKLTGRLKRQDMCVPKSIDKVVFFTPVSPRVVWHISTTGPDALYCNVHVAEAETMTTICHFQGLAFERVQTEKLEPEVLKTSWENVGSVNIVEIGKSYDIAKPMVLVSDCTELGTALALAMTKVNSSVKVLDRKEHTTQIVRRILTECSEPDTLLIVMQTDQASQVLNSSTIMSKNKFTDIQREGPLFCTEIYTALQQHGLKPRFLLVTQGAYCAMENDKINPFSSILPTIGLTINHEEPTLGSHNVDLPVTASVQDCVQIMLELISQESYLQYENCIAVRYPVLTDKEQQLDASRTPRNVLVPRVKTERLSATPGVRPISDWSLRVSDQRISVQTCSKFEAHDQNEMDISVGVEAFILYKDSHPANERVQNSLLCVYAGKANGQSAVMGKSGAVLAIKACTQLLPCMVSKSSEMMEVPSFLTSAEAVRVVRDYLPSAIMFKEALPFISRNRSVLFKVDALERNTIASARIAKEHGAETLIVKDDHNLDQLKSFGTVVSHLGEIAERSIDALFVSGDSLYLSRSLQLLTSKLRRNATVVIFRDRNAVTKLQVPNYQMKIAVIDADLPSSVDGLTSTEISKILTDLWQLFDPDRLGDNLPVSHNENKKLSSIAASFSDIPDGEVIEVDKPEIQVPLSLEMDRFAADEKSTYFISGGNGGFGLKLLEWLISRGARYICTGSRKKMSDEYREVSKYAKEFGVQVRHIQMDISDATSVEMGLLRMTNEEQGWPPLKGIFHCAAIFSDTFLFNMTTESWNSVMMPKAYGALLLHQLTLKLGIQLDHLILISSVVSLLGNAGQGSYCAANAFLDSLAQYRYNHGLPAMSIQIGVINSVGFAMNQNLVHVWEEKGMKSLNPKEPLDLIGCALSMDLPQLGIMGSLNRKRYAATHKGLMHRHFREQSGTISALKDLFFDRDVFLPAENHTVCQSIMNLPHAEALELVVQTLANLLRMHLGLSAEVSPDASPVSLGVDSLMASEVSQTINHAFEVSVGPVDLLNDKTTVHGLAKGITKQTKERDLSSATDDSVTKSQEGSQSFKKTVVEGKQPNSVNVKLVCFPSTGAGPSMFLPFVEPLLAYGIQVLMIQLPGWEGREDEPHETDLNSLTQVIHDELVPVLSGYPFAFFGYSMGCMIAVEVAHALLAQDNMFPSHMFVSAWYPPAKPYPHPEELDYDSATFERMRKIMHTRPQLVIDFMKRENFTLSFLDRNTFMNNALMRRLMPCIEAAYEMIKSYKYNHDIQLSCDLTAFGGKHDDFVSPESLSGWEMHKSRYHGFKKMIFPGKHMFILTNTADIIQQVGLACKKYIDVKVLPDPDTTPRRQRK